MAHRLQISGVMRRSIVVLVLLAACVEPDENPVVQSAAASKSECAASERLVTDACTELGPDDGCVDVDDVCVPLCDGLASCTVTGGLRVVRPWPVAPDGYCVECVTP